MRAKSAAPVTPVPIHTVNPNSVYSREDLVRIFRLKLSTIRREIRAGRLRVSKRAGRYYFVGEWLLEWLRNGEVQRQERPGG